MMRHGITFLGTAALMAGCTMTSNDPVYTAFHREAGAIVDNGGFGEATRNNRAVMSGEQGYAISLSNRFSAEVDTTVNFAFNSAALSEQARATLNQQANFIRQFPEVRFRVYGHTDLVGSAAYNKRLGLARARAVVAYLVSQGVSQSRLEALVSLGETQPLIVTQGRERRNRRTVTEVSGFVKGHPQVLDGRYAEIIYRDYVQSAVAPTGLTTIQGRDFQTTE